MSLRRSGADHTWFGQARTPTSRRWSCARHPRGEFNPSNRLPARASARRVVSAVDSRDVGHYPTVRSGRRWVIVATQPHRGIAPSATSALARWHARKGFSRVVDAERLVLNQPVSLESPPPGVTPATVGGKFASGVYLLPGRLWGSPDGTGACVREVAPRVYSSRTPGSISLSLYRDEKGERWSTGFPRCRTLHR